MMSNRYPSYIYLTYAAVINFVFAFLHVVVPFKGVTDYIYFGTNKLALLEFHGEPLPEPAAFILALVFAVFGMYCLSGAELMRRLYLLNPVLWFIGGLYTLRGLILIPDLLGYTSGEINPTLQLFFSTAALVIGLMILIGMNKKNIENITIE